MPTPRPIIDHLTIAVSDLQRSRAFYAQALAPLGIAETPDAWDDDGHEVAFGSDFAISVRYAAGTAAHVAFIARDREQVDAFHAAAMAAGGRDHGGPGVRDEYSDGYYGAFVLDPDGHNIEAVVHETASPGSDPVAAPALPGVDSPPAAEVLDGVASPEEVVGAQPSVDEILGRS